MTDILEFRLNGKRIQLDSVSPNTTLLEWLRANGLTGSKEGCAEGDCGACSVAIIELNTAGERRYRAINSCLVPLVLMAGREIVTVEGLAGENLHPVQQAMVENHGSQCGYCTPGFVMSLFEGYYRKNLKTRAQLDEQLAGNLCRCTGYRPINAAAAEAFARFPRRVRPAAEKIDNDPFEAALKNGSLDLASVSYAWNGEKFLRPTSMAELFSFMAENPDARLIAGATELGLDISKRFQKFATLISLEAIPELTEINHDEKEWRIGGAATLTAIQERLGGEFPALADMLYLFGSRQIRNRATMGGNLVTASPIGDSAPVLLALDASVLLASATRERTLSLTDFFIGYRQTALEPGEILKTIVVPKNGNKNRRTRFYKVTKRREMDISTVAGCFTVELDAKNAVKHARLAFGGVAPVPARALKTEEALAGKTWDFKMLEAILPVLDGEFTPISDVRGSKSYRQRLVTNLFEKFFYELSSQAVETANDDQLQSITGLKPGSNEKGANERPAPHESGHKHVTGEAIYVDDTSVGQEMLEVWPICSPHAHARVVRRDVSAAKTMPGVVAVLLAEDIPGLNDVGAVRHDEILLADKEVSYHGQIVAVVVGETQETCRAAAEKVVIEYDPLPPIFTIQDAIEQNSFHTEANHIERGDFSRAFIESQFKLEGEFAIGGQDHFYLETQAAWAERGEDGTIFVASSTQHPGEEQHIIAHLLALPMHSVVVQCPRMGGGFGGKETQAAIFAALAALAASKTGRKVRVRCNRDQDMMITGKRHPFLARFRVGFDQEGFLQAVKIDLYSNGGWTLDLSRAVTDRAVFHLDNGYYIPNVEFKGFVAKTNLGSNTAFRGFGGPQGMLAMEEIIDRVARQLGLSPETVRVRNLYRGTGETNTTHYGQEIEDNRLQRVWHELMEKSEFVARREQLRRWNAKYPHRKRGIAITPVKFGISFTTTHLNQAGALVLLYQDGTAQVNHGGTEMGQGVHTNVAAIAAKELGISLDRVRVMPTQTDKVPNTSATAASCGTDLNGAAVKNACDTLRSRLLPFAVEMLGEKNGRAPDEAKIRFANNEFFDIAAPDGKLAFADLLRRAYFARTSLSATGFYQTPDIHFDRDSGQGKPFHYFAVGAAVSEVEIDGFSGMMQVTRVDILHDAGDVINAGVARGQIEGGFIQGMGWLTAEELIWDEQGKLLTHSPDTYKIPAVGDTPRIFNVEFLTEAAQRNVIHGAKAVGEPPLMLSISVREAIRDAIAAFGEPGGQIPLPSPATPEAIFMAIEGRRASPVKTAPISVR
jgi:xanthine dehydrogenase molybdopterin binding subunit/xanthine dehydrogenase small subunit